MNGTELNRTADIGIIRRLYRDGLLSDDAFIAASGVLRPVSSWFSWARRMLILYGSALVLAGVIYFFAYNWDSMGKFLKFGLIEAGIIGCIVASYLRERKRLSGKILLLSASVMVGVLLAVYGQTYQTGADAYELFIGWSVLILGWVIVSEFAALWLLWLVILNTGAILYWLQVGEPAHSIQFGLLCLAVAALNGTALVLCEMGRLRKLEWLSGRWLRVILFAASLFVLSRPTSQLIVDFDRAGGVNIIAAIAWVGAVVSGYVLYRFKLRDMVPIALIAVSASEISLTLIGKVLFHNTGFDEAGLFLLFALIIVAVVSGAVFWLRKTALTMANEMKESAA